MLIDLLSVRAYWANLAATAISIIPRTSTNQEVEPLRAPLVSACPSFSILNIRHSRTSVLRKMFNQSNSERALVLSVSLHRRPILVTSRTQGTEPLSVPTSDIYGQETPLQRGTTSTNCFREVAMFSLLLAGVYLGRRFRERVGLFRVAEAVEKVDQHSQCEPYYKANPCHQGQAQHQSEARHYS